MAAINMLPTDRIPRDFHCCEVVRDRLYQHFQIKSYKELMMQLDSDIVDIRGIVDPEWIADFPNVIERVDGSTQNYLGFCMKEQDTVFGRVAEHCDYLLSKCETLEEIKQFSFPKASWFDFSKMSEQLDEYSDFAIMASGASVYQHPTLVRGLDQFLCDLLVDPEIAIYIIDQYVNFYYVYFDRMFTECKGKIDILRIADDFGMQDRPLISRDVFNKYFFERIKKLCTMAHSHNVKVMFHSCGAVFDFIDLLIEAGVDILDPLQPTATGMNPERLTEHYSKKICFHGSIDTQFVLPKGTPAEVRKQVRKHISIFNKDKTGFIIAPAHTLQPDVPIENIIAMYQEISILL